MSDEKPDKPQPRSRGCAPLEVGPAFNSFYDLTAGCIVTALSRFPNFLTSSISNILPICCHDLLRSRFNGNINPRVLAARSARARSACTPPRSASLAGFAPKTPCFAISKLCRRFCSVSISASIFSGGIPAIPIIEFTSARFSALSRSTSVSNILVYRRAVTLSHHSAKFLMPRPLPQIKNAPSPAHPFHPTLTALSGPLTLPANRLQLHLNYLP